MPEDSPLELLDREIAREMAERLDRLRADELERQAAEELGRQAAAAPAEAESLQADDLDHVVAERLDRFKAEELERGAAEHADRESVDEVSRTERLRSRRRTAKERRQTIALYALAAFVAFAAVVGGWWAAATFLGDEEVARPPGHLTLLTLTAPGSGDPVAAALVVRDEAAPRYALYVIPRELLLEGPGGEYVFAGDSMTTGDLRGDLERVIGTSVDAAYTLPVTALGALAGADVLEVELERPVTVVRDGTQKTYDDSMVIVNDDLPGLFATSGSGGYDGTTIQEGLWRAVLAAAARRSSAPSPVAAGVVTAASGTADRWYLEDALAGLTAGNAVVARVPSTSRVAEGQFAFVPDAAGIMADITRKRGGFQSAYTVAVRNGSGRVGIGAAVVAALSALDVNLPEPTNADRFNYRQTRILAGSGALAVAEDVRAILGRGVVLNGADVPANTVVVIVGNDLRTKDLKPKDQP